MKNLIKAWVLVQIILASQLSFAKDRECPVNVVCGDGSHGEDPKAANIDRYRTELETNLPKLKTALLNFVRVLDIRKKEESKDPSFDVIAEMARKGLMNDILISEYDIKEEEPCFEDVTDAYGNVIRRDEVPASAKLNDLGGKICFSKRLLAEWGIAELPALMRTAMHEHSHHFGKDNTVAIKLGTFVWKFAERISRSLERLDFIPASWGSNLGVSTGTEIRLPYGRTMLVDVRFTLRNTSRHSAFSLDFPGMFGEASESIGVEKIPKKLPDYVKTITLNLADPKYSNFEIFAHYSDYQKVEIFQNRELIYATESKYKKDYIKEIVTLTWKD